MMKRAAIYARVSTTNGQTPSNQIGRLREVAEKAGWEIVEEFVDRGISGAKGRDKRLGRPPGASKKRQAKQSQVQKLHKQGHSVRQIARQVGLSPGTVQTYLKSA